MEKEVWIVFAKDTEFSIIVCSEIGFYGIMVIENLRSEVAPKEKSI